MNVRLKIITKAHDFAHTGQRITVSPYLLDNLVLYDSRVNISQIYRIEKKVHHYVTLFDATFTLYNLNLSKINESN